MDDNRKSSMMVPTIDTMSSSVSNNVSSNNDMNNKSSNESVEEKINENEETSQSTKISKKTDESSKDKHDGQWCEECETNTVYLLDGGMSCFQCGAVMESISLVRS